MQGNWTPDIVERLMLAGWYHACVAAGASMPPISELEDPYCGDEIEPSTDPLVLQAREIHDQIMERFRDRKYIRFLLLTAEVSKFWRKKHRRPTVAEIAKWMGLSKTAWYRRYKRKDLYDAILVARGQAAPYQIQGRNAKKRGFEALKRQLDQRG
jgi:hypothetical protein